MSQSVPTQYGGSSTSSQSRTGQASQRQDAGPLPQQYRQSLQAVAQAIEVCGWCADKCIEEANPNMVECIKLCEDVVEIGETVLALGPRSSRFTSELVQTFERAAQACAQECSQHQHTHCQECASVLPQAAQTARSLSQQGGHSSQQLTGGQSGQQMSSGQPGQHLTGGQSSQQMSSGQSSQRMSTGQPTQQF